MSQATLEQLTGLLSGERRIAVSDLIETGFLDAGTELEWRRRDFTHRAVLGADGSITTRANPEAGVSEMTYQSPSAAGSTIAGRPINGWDAWKVASGDNAGQTLSQRRDRFIEALEDVNDSDPAAAVAADGDLQHQPPQTSQVRKSATSLLSDAAERARAGSPRQLSVRELLSYWGAKSRGMRVIEQIENSLANHGLTTTPRFTDVALDSTVALTATQPLSGPSSETVDGNDGAEGTAPSNAADTQTTEGPSFEETPTPEIVHAVTLGNVAGGELATISVKAYLDHAITQMQLDDYSQLGVTGEQQRVIGAVTWKSICRAAHRSGKLLSDLKVQEALVPVGRYPYTRKLKDTIGDITRDGFIVVEVPGAKDKIVTVSDVADSYREMAAPFFLVGELDQRLRRAVSRIDRTTWPKDVDHDEPSFGDYIKILSSNESWQALAWPLQKRPFILKLEAIRDMRNDLMHFNSPDPAPAETIRSLENLLHMVEVYEVAHIE